MNEDLGLGEAWRLRVGKSRKLGRLAGDIAIGGVTRGPQLFDLGRKGLHHLVVVLLARQLQRAIDYVELGGDLFSQVPGLAHQAGESGLPDGGARARGRSAAM